MWQRSSKYHKMKHFRGRTARVRLPNDSSVHLWTRDDVAEFLFQNGMGQYSELLCQHNEIDGEVLLLLGELDLRLPPLSVPVLAHVKRLSALIGHLVRRESALEGGACGNGAAGNYEANRGSGNGAELDSRVDRQELGHISQRLNAFSFSDDDDDFASGSSDERRPAPGRAMPDVKFKPEIFKTIVSFLYATSVGLLTAFVMTVAHDRVPDMDKYPPLPDIFLDSVPRIEWAFQACEACAVVLGTILFVIIALHRHRFILMRRFFALMGSCFLLRCITMFVTSLSVPGAHLQCSGKVYGSYWVKMQRALEIMSGLGMSVTGVHTCGDYMFSGHTICLTMFNFFITEYTPRRMTLLHTASWVLNLFGTFFVLAAHEHYSIDVVIAFCITSRLFLYYHTLANTRALHAQRDRRARVWFPMFSYFEAEVDDVVPNVYEWPLGLPSVGTLMPWRAKKKVAED